MSKPIAGKFLLEILTKGMYSNPLHICREYIQNSVDSFDKAFSVGLLSISSVEIHINIDPQTRTITIRDNGLGVPADSVEEKLLSIGDSEKDGITARGFRGIGRLGGLAYADQVQFITSASGEPYRSIITCDCIRMRELLKKTNHETSDVMETFMAISKIEQEAEKIDEHYFEVRLINVNISSGLLDEENVMKYLAETAPIDFDCQKFIQGDKINRHFLDKGYPISTYKIFRGTRRLPLYKLYSRSLTTGLQKRTRQNDYVKDVDFVYKVDDNGNPLYIGWLAITDFSGIIADEAVQGIRIRKGNILIGDHTTFAKYFPSEGNVANRMFAGEIHALHDDLTPNSQRDDFEPSETYNYFKQELCIWAQDLNRRYRRGTSQGNAAIRQYEEALVEQRNIENQVKSGSITSDVQRERLAQDVERNKKQIEDARKRVKKAFDEGVFDGNRAETAQRIIAQAGVATTKAATISTRIADAKYATKGDLPSNYSREEKRIYERIIAVIDKFFGEEHDKAATLREMIKKELSAKKK